MHKLSALALSVALGSSMLMPITTFAYLTPDQVFGGSDTVAPPPPPTQREGESVVQQQQQQAASSREAVQHQLVPNYATPVDTYVPPPASSKGLFDQNTQYQVRQDRMQEQKAAAPTIIIGGNGDIVDGNGNVLHSGAPRISTTGPASILAGLAMMLAAGCTFAFAHLRTRKLITLA